MRHRLRSAATAGGMAMVVIAALPLGAIANDFIELRDGNSIYRTNIFTFSDDQASWQVDGVNHQFTDQYFFNFGSDPTQSAFEFQDLSLISLLQPTENRFLASFSTLGGSLNIGLDSSLRGFADDSRRSFRDETLTLVNTGSAAIDFTMFSYIDFDLLDFDNPQDNSFNNDTTAFAYNLLTQSDPSGTTALVATSETPSLVHIAEYPFLISQLKGERRPELTNLPGPLINGDGSAVLQFDRSLQAGESISFRFLKKIEHLPPPPPEPQPIPEPTTVLSLGVVVGGLLWWRRR